MRLVLATNNPHKVKEIRKILPESFELLDLKQAGVTEELPETSGTIEGNAIQKALRVWELIGMQCVADDSGLEVEVLGGKPGVDSAHFAGLPRNDGRNIIYLLDQLEGVQNRRAGFRTVLAYVQNGEVFTFEGTVQGVISNAQRGTGGFGYDPVFVPEGYEKSFAELPAEVKNSISHRANALKLFHDFIVKR
ncbi:MAG: RdgB/HAM1 family non-canonical purine NTP pyrophosphatase [Bacteroidetes bacterium]|nr:RdgB/HAM1 family non-canonical purine NTP pyrophosphatase [Bacteroidota bacterium]